MSGMDEKSFSAPGARVLVVDDARMNLAAAVGLLKCFGMQVDTANGGAEAVERAAANRYDLILMDRLMPEMDGPEALRRIRARADGASRDAPVICLTADKVKDARERCLAEGFSDYLPKPVGGAELAAMLMRHLPADKVRTEKGGAAAEGAGQKAESGGADAFAPLRGAGIDPRSGLTYSGGDEALYRSLLSRYAGEAEEKASAMRGFFEARDWKNYGIQAHSLKSGSKMIGAAALSALAAALEHAANEGNGEAVAKGHAAVMARYAETASAIRALCPPGDEAEEDGDDDILEFLPD